MCMYKESLQITHRTRLGFVPELSYYKATVLTTTPYETKKVNGLWLLCSFLQQKITHISVLTCVSILVGMLNSCRIPLDYSIKRADPHCLTGAPYRAINAAGTSALLIQTSGFPCTPCSRERHRASTSLPGTEHNACACSHLQVETAPGVSLTHQTAGVTLGQLTISLHRDWTIGAGLGHLLNKTLGCLLPPAPPRRLLVHHKALDGGVVNRWRSLSRQCHHKKDLLSWPAPHHP